MRTGMGNQNTSGFIEEGAVENGQEPKPESVLEERNNRTKESKDDLKETNGGLDFIGGVEADNIDPGRSIEDLKEINDIDTGTQMHAMPNESSNDVETKESSLEEGSHGDSMNDTLCSLKGEASTKDSEPNQTSMITTEHKQEENIVLEAIEKAQGHKDSNKIQIENNKSKAEIMQASNATTPGLFIDDDLDVAKSVDECTATDTVPGIQELSERCTDEENLVSTAISDNDGMTNKFSDSFTVKGEKEAIFQEQSAVSNEESGDLNPSMAENRDQTQANEGMSKFEIESDIDGMVQQKESQDSMTVKNNVESHEDRSVVEPIPLLDEDAKSKAEQYEMVFDNKEMEQVQVDDSTENQEDSEQTRGNDKIEHDVISNSTKKDPPPPQSQPPVEYNFKPTKSDVSVSSRVSEPEFEPNPRDTSVQVELRKSPSFDFGVVPYHPKSQESDQTPLLYDRIATRSFSDLRFQSRSVQTEQAVAYEPVEVEEKTIRMERSDSVNHPDNHVFKAGQDVVPLSKGTGKKKARTPSIFTTCICCSNAMS